MAQYKRPTIADRNNEYRAKRIPMISPERQDPFDGGGFLFFHLLKLPFFFSQ